MVDYIQQYNILVPLEKNICDQIINKIRVKFCSNPNEIHINPNRILYISSFIFKELKNITGYESEYIKLCRIILQKLMEYFLEYISVKENINYIIEFLLEDFYNVINEYT